MTEPKQEQPVLERIYDVNSEFCLRRCGVEPCSMPSKTCYSLIQYEQAQKVVVSLQAENEELSALLEENKAHYEGRIKELKAEIEKLKAEKKAMIEDYDFALHPLDNDLALELKQKYGGE